MAKRKKFHKRLNVRELQEIVRLTSLGRSRGEIAEMFGILPSSVKRIVKRMAENPKMIDVKYGAESSIYVDGRLVKLIQIDNVEHAWVPECEWVISATKCGRVFSHRNKFEEILDYEERKGKYSARFYINGVRTTRSRGRVVLSAWTGVPLDTELHCCHNSGNALDDSLENLRWDTHQGNMRDRTIHGTLNWQKLTRSESRDVIRLYTSGEFTVQEIADEFEMTISGINSLIRRWSENPDAYAWSEHETKVIKS